ncbi:MAG: lipoprotein insertase outer membrane protein LolB [Pontibacterium sp.]
MRRRLSGLIAILLIISGCSGLKPQPKPPVITTSWEQHQQELLQLKNWALSGKIAIKTETNSHSASLYWHQENDHYRIDMSGPLGQGGAYIEGQPGYVRLAISGEGEYEATSPEHLLQDRLGWDIPIQQARWWVRGLPDPESPYQHQLKNNRLTLLMQNGWLISYLSYNEQQVLPRKIKLSRENLKITLLMKDWKPIE